MPKFPPTYERIPGRTHSCTHRAVLQIGAAERQRRGWKIKKKDMDTAANGCVGSYKPKYAQKKRS